MPRPYVICHMLPGGRQAVRHLKLLSCEALGGDLAWLRYKVRR